MNFKKKIYTKRNFVFTLNNPKIKENELIEKFKSFDNLKYATFQLEKGKTRETPHYQGYLEFNKPESFKNINNKLFDNLAYIAIREGTQKEAIDYCQDEKKRLNKDDKYYEYGIKKREYNLYNVDNSEIPRNEKEQWIYLEQKIIDGSYVLLDDIHKDFPYLVIHYEKKILNLLDKYNSIDFTKPMAKMIWLWGKSGAGKTVWTIQYLRNLNKDLKNVCLKKSPHGRAPRLWFDKEDRNKEILWIEEVRKNFPHKNDILQLIDSKTLLETKHGHVRNNFKLIIINSLLPPWEVYPVIDDKFNPISEQEQQEILRRIFEGRIINIIRNDDFFNKNKDIEYKELLLNYKPYEKQLTDGKDKNLYLKYLDKNNKNNFIF